MRSLLDFFRNSTPTANCFVAPELESSSASCTLSFCAPEDPGTSSAGASLERSLFQYLTLSLFCLLLSGCGYTLGEIKPTTMRRVNTISVGTFKNETLIPRLESQTADAVAKQFQQDGTYRIEMPDRADANLVGTIVSVKRQPMRVYASNVQQTSEFELILVVDYVVRDRLTGALLLKGKAEGHTPFFVNSDNVNSDLVTDQNMNYPIAAQRAAEALVSKVSEGW